MDLKLPKKEEFEIRWEKAKKMMNDNNLDILLVYSNDKNMHGQGNVRYFSNFPAHFEEVFVLLPIKGDPILLTGPECKEYAELVSFISDVRTINEFTLSGEDYPYTTMAGIGDIIDELEQKNNIKVKNIGIIGLDIISNSTFVKLKNSFNSKFTIADSNFISVDLKKIKSLWEQKNIVYGYNLCEKALEISLNELKPGVSEFFIAAKIEEFFRRNGSEANAVDTIVSFGKKNTYPIVNRPTFNKLQKNDFGILTFGPRIQGYNVSIGRPFFIGKTPKEAINSAKIALEAQIQCSKYLKPGIRGSEVEAIGRKILKENKLEKYFAYSGIHSVGLSEFELPILGPTSKDVIETGMVLSIDIPIFITPWGGLRFEDGFLITNDGNKFLSNFHHEIIYI